MEKIKVWRYIEVAFKCMMRPNKYSNTFPYNCGYYDGEYLNGDCWCTNPKTIIWGEALGTPICDNYTKGYFINPSEGYAATGLPDWTGDNIMWNLCEGVTTDFSKLTPGELLLIDGDHMGIYLGWWNWNGKVYNTFEVTSNTTIADGTGFGASYVTEDGRRLGHKDGAQFGTWNRHGKLSKWIDYTGVYDGIANDVLNEMFNPKQQEPAKEEKPIALDKDSNDSDSPFSDVSSTHPKFKHIKALFDAGIVNGYKDGTFHPDEPITRADVCIIVNKALRVVSDWVTK